MFCSGSFSVRVCLSLFLLFVCPWVCVWLVWPCLCLYDEGFVEIYMSLFMVEVDLFGRRNCRSYMFVYASLCYKDITE